MAGPLTGVKVVELQANGPGPFGTMILADLGADVISVSRTRSVGNATPTPRLHGSISQE